MLKLCFLQVASTPTTGPTETPTITPTATPTITPSTTPSASLLTGNWQGVLVIIALMACVGCIGLIVIYGRRLQNSAYMRSSLVDALADKDAAGIIAQLDGRIFYELLDYKQNPLKGAAAAYKPDDFWGPNRQGVLSYDPSKDVFVEPQNATQEQVEAARAAHEKQVASKVAFKAWAEKELELYEKEKERIRKDSRDSAEKRVPKSMEVSLLGGGFTFILEFTTIIVIIFAVIIFGVIGILEGKEIAAILAAIAGYVLGRATTAASSSSGQAPPGNLGKEFEDLKKEFEELKGSGTTVPPGQPAQPGQTTPPGQPAQPTEDLNQAINDLKDQIEQLKKQLKEQRKST